MSKNDNIQLSRLLSRKRFSSTQLAELAELLQAEVHAGNEAPLLEALAHSTSDVASKARRLLLQHGSAAALERLAVEFDNTWNDGLTLSNDSVAAVFKLSPSVDRFLPLFDALQADDFGTVTVASTVITMICDSWRPDSASSWNNLGVPFDVPRQDPRWLDIARRVSDIPKLSNAAWIVLRCSNDADEIGRILDGTHEYGMAYALEAIDNPKMADAIRASAKRRKGKLAKAMLARADALG